MQYTGKKELYSNAIRAILLVVIVLSLSFLTYYFINADVSGDDENYYKHVTVNINWLIHERYLNWSSRIFIESVIPFFVNHLLLFKLVCITFLFGSVFILKGISQKTDFCVFGAIVVLFPYYEFKSAGFVATTLNYYFPVIISLFLVYLILRNSKINIVFWVVFALASAFAANHDQSSLSLLIISTIIFIKNKKLTTLNGTLFFVSVASVAFILLCPGNSKRLIAEANNWMPEFLSFSLFDKVYLGITTTLYNLCYHNNIQFVFCCVVVSLALTGRISIAAATFIMLSLIKEYLRYIFRKSPVTKDVSWLGSFPVSASLIIVALCVILCLAVILIKTTFCIKAVTLSLIGTAFMLRAAVGFSPTVFSSSVRPDIIPQCLLVLSAYFLISKVPIKKVYLHTVLVIFTIMNFNKYILGYSLL